ncbi:hypothetical protein C8Q80DRAFT_1122567 [Daedaleopsis nitida]|nr:hypothetical protein C8Q80DRAFT_1122567 [Daedaleopsis nitida]
MSTFSSWSDPSFAHPLRDDYHAVVILFGPLALPLLMRSEDFFEDPLPVLELRRLCVDGPSLPRKLGCGDNAGESNSYSTSSSASRPFEITSESFLPRVMAAEFCCSRPSSRWRRSIYPVHPSRGECVRERLPRKKCTAVGRRFDWSVVHW